MPDADLKDPQVGAAADLESELQGRREYADGIAFRLDRAVGWCWWGAIICAGIASALGFVAEIPEVRDHIQIEPWMISVFALIGGGLEIVRRKTSWRAKSNLFYQHRDDVDHLLSRIRYELPRPLSADHIAMIAKEYREKKLMWGDKMRKLNDLVDEKAGAAETSPQPTKHLKGPSR